MPNDILGGGLFFAIAALLWLLYLMPSWAKRREYLATERNALRLQQTLRIMAETSEVPREVSVAIDSRSVHEQQRLLQYEEKLRLAQERARRAASARQVKAELREVRAMSSQQKHRIRRSRLISTLLLVLSVIAIVVSSIVMATGVGEFAWLLGAALATGIGSLVMLRQLAQVSRSVATERRNYAVHESQTVSRAASVPQTTESMLPLAPVKRTWEPRELPKPLYLARAEAAPKAASSAVSLHDQLARHAARQAELIAASQASVDRVRQAEAALPTVQAQSGISDVEIVAQQQQPATENRFARMGVIDQQQIARPNVDEALRRRRSVS